MAPPRLCKYERIIRRFYEVVILASYVRKVHGSHLTVSHDHATDAGARRRFLKNLAFLCDYVKGGPTTAGLAVEERVDCYVFWLSSNEGPSAKVAAFLQTILDILKNVPDEASNDENSRLESMLLKKAASFARRRVFREQKLAANAAMKMLLLLEQEATPDEVLCSLLRQFQVQHGKLSPADICQFAYDIRNAPELLALERHKKLSHTAESMYGATSAPRQLVHFIRRLAARVRAVKQLIEDAPRVQQVLSSWYLVEALPRPECVQVPNADKGTNLRGILNRMLSTDDGEDRLPSLSESLHQMDKACRLEQGILSRHGDGEEPLHPCVHAEVQQVDHFSDNHLRFWANDPYIGCSKDSCLLCRLYMEYHPNSFVTPDSHNKIYPNWGPAALAGGASDSRFKDQRNILIKIIHAIRGPVLEQIGSLSKSNTFRADSLDQITATDDDRFAFIDFDDEVEPSGQGVGSILTPHHSDVDTEDWETSDSDGGVGLQEADV